MKNNNISKSAFGINDSLAIKGIAILLMLFHHCFRLEGLMEKYDVITSPFDVSTVINIALLAKICVSIFAFISGYGLYLSAKTKCTDLKATQSWTVQRLIKTLSGFWFVYILVFISTQIYAGYPQKIYGENGIASVIVYAVLDFSGLAHLLDTPSLISTWWYMSASVVFIAAIPVIVKYINKFGAVSLVSAVVIMPRIFGGGYPGETGIYTFFFALVLGILFAEYDLFGKADRIKLFKNKYLNGLTMFIILSLLFVIASYLFFKVPIKLCWEYNYGIYPVIFIYFCKRYIVRIPVIDKILAFFGKHSMNIFLTHTFIRSTFFKDFTYSFKYFLLIEAVLFAISLAISIIIIEPLKKLTRFEKLSNKLSKKMCGI